MKHQRDSPFWQLPFTALLKRLAASPEGLSSAEAALRLARFGPNLVHGEHKKALVLQFLAKFRNPLVIVLLTASALSAFTGAATSFFIIAAIVLMSVTLDFVQEYRAGQAADRLRLFLPFPPCCRCRSCPTRPLPARTLVLWRRRLPFFLILIAMLVAYLLAVEWMKRWFFRRFAAE